MTDLPFDFSAPSLSSIFGTAPANLRPPAAGTHHHQHHPPSSSQPLQSPHHHPPPERQAENKRKLDNNNQAQQQPSKKQGVAIAYIAGPGERKEYTRTLPLYNKSPAATNNQRNPTCYKCGNQGHYRSDCLELKNQNHRNQAGYTRARGMVHALGAGETNQDLNNIEDDINA
nr:hypothetical protein [Tanacetum cinerariifolium]